MTAYLGSDRWKPATLQDLVTFQRGFDITKAEQKEGEIPVISSSGVSSWHDEAMVEGPGVVIGRKGSLGTVHYSEGPYWPHDTTLWSKSLHGNNPRFAYYALRLLRLERFNVGGANPTLNRNHIHGLPIFLADRKIQDEIAKILTGYDDLIENNRRRIGLLEEAARLLYREWFVYFRFPGHEHVRITNGLPEGWESRLFGNLVSVVKENVKPANFADDDIHIGLEHIPRRSFTLSDWEPAEGLASGKIRFHEGDILFGKIRPYFHKVGFALGSGLASSDAIVMRVKEADDWPLVLCTASSDRFVAVASKTVREGSKMPRADWNALKKYPIPHPPSGILAIFNENLLAVTAQCKTLALENHALSQARDLLLPRLMNGEIAV